MNPSLGIGLKVASALTFTVMSACVKTLVGRFPIGEVVFSRAFFALIPLILWLHWRGEWPEAAKTALPGQHVWRGVIGGSGTFLGFTTLSLLPLPEATALGYVAPLLTVVLAAVLLKETVRIYRWSAVVIGFIGMLVMIWPNLSLSPEILDTGRTLGIASALAAATCAAVSTVQVRRLTMTETTGTIVFYFSLVTSSVAFLTIFAGWRMPTASEAALLVFAGMLGGIGQILLTQSFFHADTSLIAPFEYTTMLFALAIGWFVFAEFPPAVVLVGAAIVVAAGLFVIWREHRLGLERRKARAASPPRAV